MHIPEYLHIFALGALGGCLVELLRWWKLRESPEFPVYAKKPGYWIITILMIGAGGFLATLYGLDSSNAVALINIGASTPAILGAMASKTDKAIPEYSGLGERSFNGNHNYSQSYLKLFRKFIAFGR